MKLLNDLCTRNTENIGKDVGNEPIKDSNHPFIKRNENPNKSHSGLTHQVREALGRTEKWDSNFHYSQWPPRMEQ